MNLQQVRFLSIEKYKTINSLNPDFVKNIFEMKKKRTQLSGRDIS